MTLTGCFAACLLALAAAAGHAAQEAAPKHWWRMPASAEVPWRGQLPTEGGAVGIGPQIGPYIVPGPIGLLVAIAAHGAIMQGVQSAQRKREQDDADKVLEPYAGALKAWPASSLWEAAVGGRELLWDGAAPAPGAVVELAPIFSMAQDESALLLDAAVTIVAPNAAGSPAAPVAAVVRVVSSPHAVADARGHWSADDARRLKATAAAMLSHAVDVVSRHAAAAGTQARSDAGTAEGPPPPVRTHRYRQGSSERAERAQRLGGDCSRLVLRTLRGELLSVPVAAAADAACEVRAAF